MAFELSLDDLWVRYLSLDSVVISLEPDRPDGVHYGLFSVFKKQAGRSSPGTGAPYLPFMAVRPDNVSETIGREA
jgi:hypothetical protein